MGDTARPGPAGERDGIWQRFLDADGLHLDTQAWNRARAEGSPVGTCRTCGSHIFALSAVESTAAKADDAQTIQWYGTICRNPQCRAETSAPNGKVFRRSSRWSKTPSGWLATRKRSLTGPGGS